MFAEKFKFQLLELLLCLSSRNTRFTGSFVGEFIKVLRETSENPFYFVFISARIDLKGARSKLSVPPREDLQRAPSPQMKS